MTAHSTAEAGAAHIQERPDRTGWWMRAAYWWAFAGVGALTPFIALYYRELGMSGAQIGVLSALPAVGVAFLAPLWGAVADSRAAHRLALRAALVLTVLAALALTRAEGFVPLLLLVGLVAVCSAPIPSLIDSYGLAISERRGVGYGSIRVWGSLGYVAAVWAIGRWMGDQVTSAFIFAYAGCLLLALVTTVGLPPMGQRRDGRIWSGIGLVLANPGMLVLLGTAWLVSTGSSAMYAFLGIRLRELGAGAELVGTAFALNAASELPVVAFGAWFLARLGGDRLLLLSIVTYFVRFVAYTYLPNPEWVLPVQLLHGLSYGAFLIATVTLARRLAGADLAATALGLLTAVSFGLGSITGSLVGGALYDVIGAVGVFRCAAAVMVVSLAVYAAGTRFVGVKDGAPRGA